MENDQFMGNTIGVENGVERGNLRTAVSKIKTPVNG